MSHSEPEHNRPQEGSEPEKPFPQKKPKLGTRRHNYQQGNNLCDICGKEIDHPIHIPLI